MNVFNTYLQPIIEGKKQYVIPLFQRPYVWGKLKWETLLEDLLSLKDSSYPHFIGAFVTMHLENTKEGVQKILLIDGQQRLITIFIMLAVLRDNVQQDEIAAELRDLLINTHRLRETSDALKILPTTLHNDRECFMSIMQNQNQANINKSQIRNCYDFFQKHLSLKDASDIETLKRLIMNHLTLVNISLDKGEDPYKIFESLNAKGEDLLPVDLIRNYFFMQIGGDRDKQEEIYDDMWKPMEERLSGNDLSEYIRHFLMKDGAVINKKDVYFALKKRLENKNPKEVIESLKELSTYSVYYEKLLKPEKEAEKSIQERLLRLNDIEVTVAYPFLLNIYKDYESKSISKDNFAEIHDIVENFLIRRFICNIQTHGLNKIFPYLYEKSKEKLIEGIKKELSSSPQKYPKDSDFKQAFKEAKLYVKSGEAKKKGRVILERLELYQNKEPVNLRKQNPDGKPSITIEHIMPQTLTDWWKEHLGDDWESTYKEYLNNIGNLTLSGVNSENSNHSFPEKKKNFQESNLKLNKWIIKENEWNEKTIQKRARDLAEMALDVWKYFGSEPDDKRYSPETVKGTKPISVVIKGNSYPVSSWRDVMIKTTEFIIANNPKTFDKIIENHPQFLSWNAQAFTRNHCLSNDMYLQINWSSSAIVRFCIDIMKESGFSKEDWHVES